MSLLAPLAIEEFKKAGTRFSPRVTEFPSMVLVDVTTRCNLACIHCPSSVLSAKPEYLGDIDRTLYRKIVDEIAEYPDTFFRPFDSGEPLLRRDLPEFIAYAKSSGIKQVAITTNGTLLIERTRTALIEAGLDHLEVSLDAATAETYQHVRQSPLFDRVVDHTLRYIDQVKARYPERTVTVSFVAQASNHHEQDAFATFWRGKADAVYVREYHQHNNLVSAEHRIEPRAADPALRHPCPFLYERLIVHHDGSVRFCEFDWEAKHTVGNAWTHTLKDIWQGEQYRRLRAQHVCGTFDHPFCKSCTDWSSVRWNGL